jgi:signal transduction histidine kinase
MAESLEHSGGAGKPHESSPAFDPVRHIAPTVAHELNNILTIVQGYSDRLVLRHGEDPALTPYLKLISEAARRAAVLVRNATPSNAGQMFRQQQNQAPHAVT